MISMMEDVKELPHSKITGKVLECCFEVINELGPGFIEKIYRNALLVVLKSNNLIVETERSFDVIFRGISMGRFYADMIVENAIIIELKCCEQLIRAHQAQLFNYLKMSGLPVGLLVNFQHSRLEYKRLHRPT